MPSASPACQRRRSAALTVRACGDPPDKEIQQAQAAIDAARAAGADRFAREEFAAAEDALDACARRGRAARLPPGAQQRPRRARARADRRHANRPPVEDRRPRGRGARTDRRGRPRWRTRSAKLKAAETGTRAGRDAAAGARSRIALAENAVQEARTAFGRRGLPGRDRQPRAKPTATLRQIRTICRPRRQRRRIAAAQHRAKADRRRSPQYEVSATATRCNSVEIC